MRGGNIRPAFLFILVEAPDKDDLPIEMSEFRETRLTAQRIDDARVILPHDIDSSLGCVIDIPSTGIARIRKQFGGRGAACRTLDVQREIESLEEWIRRRSYDGQPKSR